MARTTLSRGRAIPGAPPNVVTYAPLEVPSDSLPWPDRLLKSHGTCYSLADPVQGNGACGSCLSREAPMAEVKLREAVGVFHEEATLRAAVDALLIAGFDRSDLSLLAGERRV